MDITGKVKGTLLLTRVRYLRGMGATMASRVLARLTREDRELLDGTLLLPALWYPADVLWRLEQAIAAEAANGDRASVLVDVGQFAADKSFGANGVLRAYVREDDPHALLREVQNIHLMLRGYGKREYERVDERAAVVRAGLERGRDGDDCLTTVGWLRRAIELCGGRDVQVTETACLARGGGCCEYRCEWR